MSSVIVSLSVSPAYLVSETGWGPHVPRPQSFINTYREVLPLLVLCDFRYK